VETAEEDALLVAFQVSEILEPLAVLLERLYVHVRLQCHRRSFLQLRVFV